MQSCEAYPFLFDGRGEGRHLSARIITRLCERCNLLDLTCVDVRLVRRFNIYQPRGLGTPAAGRNSRGRLPIARRGFTGLAACGSMPTVGRHRILQPAPDFKRCPKLIPGRQVYPGSSS